MRKTRNVAASDVDLRLRRTAFIMSFATLALLTLFNSTVVASAERMEVLYIGQIGEQRIFFCNEKEEVEQLLGARREGGLEGFFAAKQQIGIERAARNRHVEPSEKLPVRPCGVVHAVFRITEVHEGLRMGKSDLDDDGEPYIFTIIKVEVLAMKTDQGFVPVPGITQWAWSRFPILTEEEWEAMKREDAVSL